jgi:hypothetical protein
VLCEDENEVLDYKNKKVPGGEPSLAFQPCAQDRSWLSVECSTQAAAKLEPYSPESRCGATLCGPLITCGEGVGEISGDSIAINWLTVTKW